MGKIAVYHCPRRRREYKAWTRLPSVACPKAGRRSSAAALAAVKPSSPLSSLFTAQHDLTSRAFLLPSRRLKKICERMSLLWDMTSKISPTAKTGYRLRSHRAQRNRRDRRIRPRGLVRSFGYAIDSIGAKRVVLDTIESIFAGLPNPSILRAELRRLFRWLKDKGVTAIVTGERGDSTLTRQGLEEYVSDCVILLDHRTREQISTRRLQIIKYRGSIHGTNEYPFLIDEHGISVLPITSIALEHKASSERISSGVTRLDAMLGGKGYYRGTSILVSGIAGTGKSSLAAHFVDAACRRGEPCVYFATEESPDLIVRKMRSIGIDLGPG